MRVLEKQKLVCNTTWSPGQEVELHIEQYQNGRVALQLWSQMEGEEPGAMEPFMTCSVNLPDSPCASNEVFIKDYGENEGITQQLIRWQIIEPTPTGFTGSGHVVISKYRFTADFMMEMAAVLTRKTTQSRR